VLDVGCGAGVTAQLIKEKFPGARVVGLEMDPALADMAAERVDALVLDSAESAAALARLAELGPYDLIICADVLEHLQDPWRVLVELSGLLSPKGELITSIPNVRHLSTFISLGFMGRWPRRDRGIHDKTHLRFFARRDVLELGASAGLDCVRERRNLRLVESMPWTMVPAKAFDFWPLRPFLTFQYLHLWRRRRA
jgi:SAM-dependent methyltransferase